MPSTRNHRGRGLEKFPIDSDAPACTTYEWGHLSIQTGGCTELHTKSIYFAWCLHYLAYITLVSHTMVESSTIFKLQESSYFTCFYISKLLPDSDFGCIFRQRQ